MWNRINMTALNTNHLKWVNEVRENDTQTLNWSTIQLNFTSSFAPSFFVLLFNKKSIIAVNSSPNFTTSWQIMRHYSWFWPFDIVSKMKNDHRKWRWWNLIHLIKLCVVLLMMMMMMTKKKKKKNVRRTTVESQKCCCYSYSNKIIQSSRTQYTHIYIRFKWIIVKLWASWKEKKKQEWNLIYDFYIEFTCDSG